MELELVGLRKALAFEFKLHLQFLDVLTLTSEIWFELLSTCVTIRDRNAYIILIINCSCLNYLINRHFISICRSEEPVTSNMDISTGHIVLVSTIYFNSTEMYVKFDTPPPSVPFITRLFSTQF